LANVQRGGQRVDRTAKVDGRVVGEHNSSGVRRRATAPRMPVLVVEDDALFARVLHMVLEEDCEAIIAGSLAAATRLLPLRDWRGVLLDIRLPDGDGTTLLPAIRERAPKIPVIVMTGAESPVHTHAAYRHGAWFLAKPMPPRWYSRFRDRMHGLETAQSLPDQLQRIGLTPSEVEVFTRLGSGETAGEVAVALGVSVNTVRTHATNVHRRLGVGTLAEVLGVAAGWFTGTTVASRR
jgi:DNA-binding NarL/FixJ family response regulator